MNIRRIIKNNNMAYHLALSARNKIYRKEMGKYASEPLVKNQVLFNNFNGRGFGDNPKAMAEAIHGMDPSVKLLWAVKEQDETLPSYIGQVLFETAEYYRALSTSAVWVSNVFMPDGVVKRDGQLYIQTWHGDRPLKKIFNDAARDLKAFKDKYGEKDYFEAGNCDYITSASTFAEDLYRRSVGFEGKFIDCGCPRNDRLVEPSSEEIEGIKEKLGIAGKKVLLFAPTFRDNKVNEGTNDSDIRLSEILDALEKKTGGDWICLLRAHGGTQLVRKNEAEDARFMDVTRYPDMTDLLLVTDYLITDYSSCATDFAMTGRPVMFYQDDIEEYKAKSRTLYYTEKDECFSGVRNMSEALKFIADTDEEEYKKRDREILDFFDTHESGKSSEECARIIVEKCNSVTK